MCTTTDDLAPLRPVSHYKNILSCAAIREESTPFLLPPGDCLQQPGEKDITIWLIYEGIFTISRNSDNICVVSGQAPFVFGLAEALRYRGDYRLSAETECYGYHLPAEIFKKLADKNALWQDVTGILSYMLQCLMVRDAPLVTGSAYPVIRNLLLTLMALPADIRRAITVEDFIRQRVSMSRSNIHRILSALRSGGYITIQRGRLVSIRFLPEKY